VTGAHERHAERQIVTLRNRLSSLTGQIYETLDEIQKVTDGYMAHVQEQTEEGRGDASARQD
jgi:hypothetical protein